MKNLAEDILLLVLIICVSVVSWLLNKLGDEGMNYD